MNTPPKMTDADLDILTHGLQSKADICLAVEAARDAQWASHVAGLERDVLAALDALSDDAAAHIYPSDLEKCSRSECVVEVVSVRATDMRTGEKTVPLFSRQQVAAAIAQQGKGGA